jgi:hypothetical protein
MGYETAQYISMEAVSLFPDEKCLLNISRDIVAILISHYDQYQLTVHCDEIVVNHAKNAYA